MNRQELHEAVMQKVEKLSDGQLQKLLEILDEFESMPERFLNDGVLEQLFKKYDDVFRQLA